MLKLRTVGAVLMCLTSPATGIGATIDAFPGPGTPLQDAIDAASAGDKVVVHVGSYSEAIVVNKRLTLVGPNSGPNSPGAVVDGGCAAQAALTVTADGVSIRLLQVLGGAASTIDIENRDRVNLKGIHASQGCPGAQYVVNIVQSTNVKVRSIFEAFVADTAAIHVAQVSIGSGIKFSKSVAGVSLSGPGGGAGALVENSAAGASLGKSGIVFKGCNLSGPSHGLLVRNSDGVVLSKTTLGGSVGVELDASSDNNLLVGNTLAAFVSPAIDAGTGNCWKKNVPDVFGCP